MPITLAYNMVIQFQADRPAMLLLTGLAIGQQCQLDDKSIHQFLGPLGAESVSANWSRINGGSVSLDLTDISELDAEPTAVNPDFTIYHVFTPAGSLEVWRLEPDSVALGGATERTPDDYDAGTNARKFRLRL